MSTAHAISPLITPFLSVDEQVLLMPAKGYTVVNRACKLLFFYEANCRHWMEASPHQTEISIESGDILVLPHWCQHHYRPHTPETIRIHALRLLFDPEVIPPTAYDKETTRIPTARNNEESMVNYVLTHFSSMAHLRGGMNSEIFETLARLRSESEGGNKSGYRFRAGAACIDLMVLVARQLEHARPVNDSRLRQGSFRVEEAREFIAKHLDTPLRLDIIAAHLQISPEHLARVWKATTGHTLFDFVRRTRIERAKTLLTASDSNISEIAVACGFSSLALFSRTFKRETGLSPGQYRERLAS